MSSVTDIAGPVFVVGFHHSGISLIHASLNQHPNIALMNECDALKLWPLVRANSVKRDWPARLELWNHSLSRHQIDPAKLPAPTDRKSAAMSLYRAFAAAKNAAIAGEKSPYYHDCLPQLAADFPNSRIIVLWRSREEILQNLRKVSQDDRAFGGSYWPQRLRVGLKSMAAGCAHLRANGHALLEIDYASLTHYSEQVMEAMLSFVGVESDPVMVAPPGETGASPLPAVPPRRKVQGGRILMPGGAAGGNGLATLAPVDQRIIGAFEPLRDNRPRVEDDCHFSAKEDAIAVSLLARDSLVRMFHGYCPMNLLQNGPAWRDRQFNAAREVVRSMRAKFFPAMASAKRFTSL